MRLHSLTHLHMSVILVTGAAGFVGWKTAAMLLEQGHEVVGMDNLNDYYDVRLKQWRLTDLRQTAQRVGKPFTFVDGDIENLARVQRLFEQHKFDSVINLAARAGVRYSLENPHVYMTTNAHGTLNLLECMRSSGVNKFVLASTSSLYAGQTPPFREDMPVDEPLSPYAATKKAAEAMAYTYHHLFGIDVTVVRYFTVYGPAGRPDMSPLRFMDAIATGEPFPLFGDGTQSRDFTYIDDIARGTIAALRPLGYEIINLGGGNEPITINYLIELLETELNRKAVIDRKPFHKADMEVTQATVEKARRLLDWTPTVSFEDGIREMVAWYRKVGRVF